MASSVHTRLERSSSGSSNGTSSDITPVAPRIDRDWSSSRSKSVSTQLLVHFSPTFIETDTSRDMLSISQLLSQFGEVQHIDVSTLQFDSCVKVSYFDIRVTNLVMQFILDKKVPGMTVSDDTSAAFPDFPRCSIEDRSIEITGWSMTSRDIPHDTKNLIDTIFRRYGEIESITLSGRDTAEPHIRVSFFDTRTPLFIHKQLQGDTVQISSPVLITSDQVISLMLSVHASSTSGLLNTPLDTPRVRRSSIGTTRTSEFSINLRNIESGSDTRTTLMIRSIPRSFTQRKLLDLLESRFAGTFDFVYLPMELTTGLNIGYMFVNMKEPAHIIPLYNSMNNRTWPTILQAVFKSSIEVSEHESLARSCKVTYGRIQGLSALINHFKSSSIMNQPDSIRPHFRKSEELSD
jgi:hypothetical protein